MSSWTVIPDSDVDADSPWDEDVATDLKENVEYVHERAVRAGTHATGVRLAIARGEVTDTASLSGGDTGLQTAAVTFSSDALDGNPNFSAAPQIMVTPEESSGSTAWGTGTYHFTYNLAPNPTTSGFTIEWQMIAGPASGTCGVIFHWVAIGPVTSGE